MKKVVILLLLAGFMTEYSNAQILKRLKEKADEVVEAQKEKFGPLDPTISQAEMAKNWEEKIYTVYTIASGGGCYEDGTLKLTLGKDANGLVTSVMLDNVPYERDEEGKSDFIRYYSSTKGSQNLMFLKDKILLFIGDDPQIYGKYYLGEKGTYSDIEKAQQYLKEARTNQTADLDAYVKKQAAEKAAKIAARKEKYGLEDKSVKSIEVTDISSQYYGFYRPVKFHITATLSDGRKISTKNGGFWEDYDIKYPNAALEGTLGYEMEVKPKAFIKGDEILIEVVCKHNRSLKATGKIPMKYNEDLAMKYNAYAWGTSGHNFKIEVKQVKHALDGSDILMIRFTDMSGSYGTQLFKMRADQTLYVYTDGHNGNKTGKDGYTFAKTGSGQNAGNGGNITVIKDPNVTQFNLEYSNNGGIGGAGTAGYNRGRDGRDGTFKETVRAVNF
ncbi:MAG: hypothetical protein AB8G11_11080 [Saprospiraceae bacterium]